MALPSCLQLANKKLKVDPWYNKYGANESIDHACLCQYKVHSKKKKGLWVVIKMMLHDEAKGVILGFVLATVERGV